MSDTVYLSARNHRKATSHHDEAYVYHSDVECPALAQADHIHQWARSTTKNYPGGEECQQCAGEFDARELAPEGSHLRSLLEAGDA